MQAVRTIEDKNLTNLKGQHRSLAGRDVFLGLSGYLYLIRESVLVVSDLHLEKASFYAKSGQFLPPYDSEETLLRLKKIVISLNPEKLVSLGDSFHDEDGPHRLSDKAKALLSDIMAMVDWTWISGNHDANLPETLGGRFLSDIKISPFLFRHEPTPHPQNFEISGHLHPSASIVVKGRRVRKPCFVLGNNRLILPAFGALTGGLDVSDEAFAPFITNSSKALLMGETKLYPIPLLNCV